MPYTGYHWFGDTKHIAYNEGGSGFGYNISLYKGIVPTSFYVFWTMFGKIYKFHTYRLYCP